MKRYIVILVIILSGLFFTAFNRQNNAVNNKYCNLTIVCDSSFRYDLFSAVFLTNTDGTLKFKKMDHNSALGITYFQWDSIKVGEYNFQMQSIFSYKQNEQFTLTKDTTLIFSNNIQYKTVDFITLKDLTKVDSLEFAYRSTGCSFHFENYLLVRDKLVYSLTGIYKNNGTPIIINKKISPLIVKSLFTLQMKSSKYVKKALINDSGGSTMRHELYLLAGRKLFLCDDKSTSCPYYDIFKEKFIETTIK